MECCEAVGRPRGTGEILGLFASHRTKPFTDHCFTSQRMLGRSLQGQDHCHRSDWFATSIGLCLGQEIVLRSPKLKNRMKFQVLFIFDPEFQDMWQKCLRCRVA